MIDYHVHTSLCGHARGTIMEYLRHAEKNGVTELCFLDHLTLQSGNNLSMSVDEIPLYFNAVQRLKGTSPVTVKVGLEVDFDIKNMDLIKRTIDTFAFDAIACSVHFIDGWNMVSRRCSEKYETIPIDDIYVKYLETLDHMLDFDFFDFIGHLDVVKKFGYITKKNFDEDFKGLIQKIASKNLAVELNTSGFDHDVGAPYPSETLLGECFRVGVPVTVSSDAHSPECVGRHRDKALEMLTTAGYQKVAVFERRTRKEITIPRK